MPTSNNLIVISIEEFYHTHFYTHFYNEAKIKYGSTLDENEVMIEADKAFQNLVNSEFEFYDNSDMKDYFADKALKDERNHKTRSFFVVSSDKDNEELLGAFSLSLKSIVLSKMNNSARRKVLPNCKLSAMKHIESIPTILIAQIGKNTKVDTPINGIDLMNLVIQTINKARSIIGGQKIVLDSVNVPKVITFYENYGFKRYGDLVNDANSTNMLLPMALDITKK